MMPRWLWASTPEAVAPISVRQTSETPMPSGTVLARVSGSELYVLHDPFAPGAVGVARAVLLNEVPGEPGVHETLVITGKATLIGRLLCGGRGINVATHSDLEQNGLKVLA